MGDLASPLDDLVDRSTPELIGLLPRSCHGCSLLLPARRPRNEHCTRPGLPHNRERDRSAPFLRRCVKLYLETPPPPKLVQIALGHLGHDEHSVKAVEAARDVLLGGESDQTASSLSTAEFIDAARAARELGLDRDHPAWHEVRRLLEGHGDGLAG